MSDAFDVSLPGLGRCLRIQQAPEVLEALGQALPGWPMNVSPARGLAPMIRLRRSANGYLQRSPKLPRGLELPTPASAVCSLIADLGGERLDQDASLIGLHCAAVEVGGRLVLFPASHRTGKSTLAAAFAAAGYRLFGDDVLGLSDEGEGMALGIAPRLRLPMPGDLAPELIEFAECHAGPEDERYRFVVPPERGLAAYAERCPVGALVLLERDSQVTGADIIRLSPGEGMLQLLCQNFARHLSPEALMTRLLPLMRRVPCLLLRYAEPLMAARCLGAALESGELATASTASLLDRRAGLAGLEPVAEQQRWTIRHGVRDYPLDDELFLIDPAGGATHRLNATGRAVWRLLCAEPLSAVDMGQLLAEHFRQPYEWVTDDLCRLLAELADSGLVVSVE